MTDWNTVPLKVRKEAANAIFVPRGFTDEFVNAMQELRDGSKEGAEAMCLVVVGEKGVGKSAFLKRYAESNPQERFIEGNVVTITRPVIYVSFPPSPTLKGTAEVFLSALAGPGSLRGSRTALTQRIKEMLIDLKTELVIADEFQHVRDEGRKGKSEVADWLKDIVKSTNIPFVLAGMPETVQIIQADEQLHSLPKNPRSSPLMIGRTRAAASHGERFWRRSTSNFHLLSDQVFPRARPLDYFLFAVMEIYEDCARF